MADGAGKLKSENSLIAPTAKIEYGNAVAANVFTVQFFGTEAEGLVCQNIQVNIQKEVRRVWEVGTDKYYIVDGKPQGQGRIQHMVGPHTKSIIGFISKWADVCNTKDEVLSLKGTKNCSGEFQYHIECKSPLLTGVGITLQAGDYFCMSDLSFSFYDMLGSDKAAVTPEIKLEPPANAPKS